MGGFRYSGRVVGTLSRGHSFVFFNKNFLYLRERAHERARMHEGDRGGVEEKGEADPSTEQGA